METVVMDTGSVEWQEFQRFLAWKQEQEQHEISDATLDEDEQQQDEDTHDDQPPVNTSGPVNSDGFAPASVTITAREGGPYGSVTVETHTAEPVQQDDPGDVQQQPTAQPQQQRARRMNTVVAEQNVLNMMRSRPGAAWTIRPPKYPADVYGQNVAWSAYDLGAALADAGVTMSVSQIRSALSRLMAKGGLVYVNGKCSKQDRWFAV